ncbi:UTRA domain-containing protein [Massilia sp. DD77]|uniref:GntR family transcriptional regulator n=1 Tax=Massilia sp. DD77 TaxID=3109349 RepID=UPI003FA60B78
MPSFRAIEHSPVPLYSQLRERILDGTCGQDTRPPAESEIGAMFGVSRIIVRQALGDLQNEGLIVKVAGKGHRIVNLVLSQREIPASAAVGGRLRAENLAERDVFLILESDYGIALGHADLQIGALNADAELAAALSVAPAAALLRIERLTWTAGGEPLDFEYLYVRGEAQVQIVDVLVIGGGTAGPMAAVRAKEAEPALRVLLLEKANVKRSGAISMGMDGLNNAVVPGFATPEQYVKEITVANDGIVNRKTVIAYAQNSYAMIEALDSWGVKSEKDETRRLCHAQGASHGHLCAADAGRARHLRRQRRGPAGAAGRAGRRRLAGARGSRHHARQAGTG